MYRGRWWISNITVLNFHMYIFNFSIHVSCTLVHRQTTFLILIFKFFSTARLEFVVGKHPLVTFGPFGPFGPLASFGFNFSLSEAQSMYRGGCWIDKTMLVDPPLDRQALTFLNINACIVDAGGSAKPRFFNSYVYVFHEYPLA